LAPPRWGSETLSMREPKKHHLALLAEPYAGRRWPEHVIRTTIDCAVQTKGAKRPNGEQLEIRLYFADPNCSVTPTGELSAPLQRHRHHPTLTNRCRVTTDSVPHQVDVFCLRWRSLPSRRGYSLQSMRSLFERITGYKEILEESLWRGLSGDLARSAGPRDPCRLCAVKPITRWPDSQVDTACILVHHF